MGYTKTRMDYLTTYKYELELLSAGLSLRRVRSKTGRAINTLRKLKDIFKIGKEQHNYNHGYSRIIKENIGFTNSVTKVIRIKQEKTARTESIPIEYDRQEPLLRK